MRLSRSSGPSVQDEILAILAEGPSYGYEIIKHLENGRGEIRLNTVYRWLSEMENRHLVESELCSGSSGPSRRVYRLAVRGRRRVRGLFKNAVSLVLQLYDEYRYYSMGGLAAILDGSEVEYSGGKILLSGVPRLIERDLELARFLVSRSDKGQIRTVGDSTVLAGSGINYHVHDGTLCDISAPSRYFQEVWICGVPRLEILNTALPEVKRVLNVGGTMRVVSSRVYFDEPTEHRLDDFLIMSAIHLFPSLGIVDAKTLLSEIEAVFGNCSGQEIFQGVGLFRGEKTK